MSVMAVGFICILLKIETNTEEIKEAIMQHTENAHIVVDRHHIITREKAEEQNE